MSIDSQEFEGQQGFEPTEEQLESVNRVIRAFDGELLHRWDTGLIVENDRLLDFLAFIGDPDVELDPGVNVQPVDLSGTTAAKLGDTIDAILIVLLVCEDKDEKAAVLEGRLGFCAAFDALPLCLREEAVKIAHDMRRRSGTRREVGFGVPVVDLDPSHAARTLRRQQIRQGSASGQG